DEGEGAVAVDGDLDGDDHPRLTLRPGVELLAELHDVDAVLTQRRPDRGRGVRRTCGNLELDETGDFLGHELAIGYRLSAIGYRSFDCQVEAEVSQRDPCLKMRSTVRSQPIADCR